MHIARGRPLQKRTSTHIFWVQVLSSQELAERMLRNGSKYCACLEERAALAAVLPELCESSQMPQALHPALLVSAWHSLALQAIVLQMSSKFQGAASELCTICLEHEVG